VETKTNKIMERELRIGNWYKADITIQGSIGAKLGFGEDRMFKMTKEHLVLILRFDLEFKIKPVPLTEEILLKCGFELGSNGWYSLESCLFDFNCLDISINQEFAAIEYGSRYDTHACNLTGNIRYLHQIQNLYFALTNEELEINL
jgi:hypothetical protein